MIKRIVSIDEVEEEFAKLAKLFNHEIVEDEKGVYRWKSGIARYLTSGDAPFYEGKDYYGGDTKVYRGTICLNNLWMDFYRKKVTVGEMMKFYMEMGYSLDGFGEIFGQKPAKECGIDYKGDLIEYILEK